MTEANLKENREESQERIFDLYTVLFYILDYIRKIIVRVRKTWMVGLVIILIVECCGIGYNSLVYKPTYVSKIVISLDLTEEEQDLFGAGANTLNKYGGVRPLQKVIISIIDSSVFEDTMKEKLGTKSLDCVTKVGISKKSTIFDVSVTGPSPESVQNTATAVAEVLSDCINSMIGNMDVNLVTAPVMDDSLTETKDYKGWFIQYLIVALIIYLLFMIVTVARSKEIVSADDVEKLLNKELLGELPRVRKFKTSKKKAMLNVKYDSSYPDAMAHICGAVEKSMEEKGWKSILLTSTQEKEGKSTIAYHMAKEMAASGKKVLLMDLDLRKCSLAKAVMEKAQNENNTSLSAESLMMLEENLYFLGMTQPTKQVGKLMKSRNIKKLFDMYKKEMDMIIVDTPASESLEDASVISEYVDAIVYVVLQGKVDAHSVLNGIQNVSEKNCPILGTIFNGVK